MRVLLGYACVFLHTLYQPPSLHLSRTLIPSYLAKGTRHSGSYKLPFSWQKIPRALPPPLFLDLNLQILFFLFPLHFFHFHLFGSGNDTMAWAYNTREGTPNNGSLIASIALGVTALSLVALCLRIYVRTRIAKAMGLGTYL